jgi:tryptophan synthase alpha chain
MSRIRAALDRLRRRRRAALIPFIMGGDPSLALTGPLLLALQEAGADVLEVGIPFSDPLADGPVIQAASARALRRGATPARVLAAVAAVRAKLRVPVVCLSYLNPLVQFASGGASQSLGAFVRAARASGIDGLIVPDLSVEELAPLRAAVGRAAFDTVLLAAPTSPPQRLRAIARASRGFIYYVSVTGTTGARRRLPPELAHGLRQLRLLTTKPVCVGFGISTPAQAAAVARVADGVIIGSALVREIAQARGATATLHRAAAFVRRMRKAMR